MMQQQNPHIGKKCVIRTYASGVHFGELVSQQGRQIELKDARRLWYWEVKDKKGISISEIALHGLASDSRVCEAIPQMTILDALEIIPTTESASSNIQDMQVYTP